MNRVQLSKNRSKSFSQLHRLFLVVFVVFLRVHSASEKCRKHSPTVTSRDVCLQTYFTSHINKCRLDDIYTLKLTYALLKIIVLCCSNTIRNKTFSDSGVLKCGLHVHENIETCNRLSVAYPQTLESNNNIKNNSEFLLGAILHRPDAPLQARKEKSQNK